MKIEFYFDFGSPNSYLSHLVIPRIEQRKKIKTIDVFKKVSTVKKCESCKAITQVEYKILEITPQSFE